MKWIIRLYALVLLGYTGWRTYDFMSQSLPANSTGQILSILFLFATEAGLLIWHETSLRSTTSEQETIAVSLTWLDFTGSLGAGIADMILRQSLTTMVIPPWLTMSLIYGLPITVALNVAGALLFISNDAETQISKAKAHLRFDITKQALKELSDNSAQIAEKMKPAIYANLRDDVTGKIESQYQQARKPSAQAPTPDQTPIIVSKPNGNGKVIYNAETADPRPKA